MKNIAMALCGAAALALFPMAAGSRPAPSTLALITKVVRDVAKQIDAATWNAAGKGDALKTGDGVRTGEQSLAVIKFTDRSIVRVREKSQIQMTTEPDGKGAVKSVKLNGGSYGFDVQKQENDKFRLTSPTSVASIRGTLGKHKHTGGNDTVVVVEGLVNLANLISKNDLDLPGGWIGFSHSDGWLSSRPATPEELADALADATGGVQKELELRLRNQQGDEKELKIRYRD